MGPSQLLLVPLCLLFLAGCDLILVTDASGDGGVDCIGRLNSGYIGSINLFMHSKKSDARINKDMLLKEFGKYSHLKKLPVFQQYLSALGKSTSLDGFTSVYCFVTNNEFERSARDYAFDEAFTLRSVRQSAYWISKKHNNRGFRANVNRSRCTKKEFRAESRWHHCPLLRSVKSTDLLTVPLPALAHRKL